MASGTPEGTVVRYRDQEFTVEEVRHYVQQIGPPQERYDAEKEVGQLMIDDRLKMTKTVEWWWHYVEHDSARATVDNLRFNEDWREVRKVANESQANRERIDTARKTMLRRWGERAEKMASHPTYNTLTKLRYLANKHTYEETLPKMGMAQAIELLYQSRSFKSVCNTHRQFLGHALGLKATSGKELDNALTIVHHEQHNLWELKTGPNYHVFKEIKKACQVYRLARSTSIPGDNSSVQCPGRVTTAEPRSAISSGDGRAGEKRRHSPPKNPRLVVGPKNP